ncbi:hypothetical protein PRIPAC_80622 [Pristionchus pacificus]|uniref:Uncharacterized protein n=1 Tax=Pristionchus pacificus TaxID=54126 RepID=A0A2A6C401_PRIPA|nr:hypothetical protein PRIPAC_80622 [Pristionchus pacificus]|eukprot:PDM72860.1 hypothetical protein PRIPAC_39294 [Pristionchus pacificus]
MNPLIDLVHIDRSHSINGTAYHTDQILLLVVGFEMISNIGVLLIYPFFCYVVIKSNIVHHNVRLQLCTAASFYSIGVLVRFYLFYCQYTVVPDDEVVYSHLSAEILRDFSRTLAVFVMTESFNLTTVIMNEVLKYTISVSACFYFMVFCGNLRIYVLRMVKVWFLFVTLSFMSYGFFVFGPNGLELWRNVSYCIFELLTALHFSTFYYLSITGNAHIHKQFCSLFPCLCRPNTVEPADLQREQTTESARYFADLRRHWN